MSENPSIKKNIAFKLTYQILAVATPLITAPYASRVLGADGIGTYSYLSSLMTYFTMFAALGTVNYGTREIARLRDDKYEMSKTFWEIELMTVFTTLVSLVMWFLLVLLNRNNTINCLALVPLLIATAADISWLYTGLEKVQYSVIWNMICKILGVILLLSFIKSKDDLTLYILMMSIIQLFGNLSMWMYVRREIVKVNIKGVHIFRHLKQTLKYFITSIAISIYTVLDKTMIGVLTKDAFQNGYYEQATKIINIVKPFAFTAINDVMTPRMAYLFEKGNIIEVKNRIYKSINVELLLAFGCCFGIISVAPIFVPLFFGDGYEPTILILQIMAPILIPICLSTCTGSHYYVPSGNILKGTKLTMIGSAVNLLVNVPLILRFGALGATVASLLAESVIGVLYIYFTREYISVKSVLRVSFTKIIAGIVMFLGITFMYNSFGLNGFLGLIVEVTVGLLIYLIMLLMLRDASLKEFKNILVERIHKNS